MFLEFENEEEIFKGILKADELLPQQEDELKKKQVHLQVRIEFLIRELEKKSE